MARTKAHSKTTAPALPAVQLTNDGSATGGTENATDLNAAGSELQHDLLGQKDPSDQAGDNQAQQDEAAKLVKMISEHGLEADVHQEMIDEYKAGGYRFAQES